MIGITAYSLYVPRFRLERSLIARAWHLYFHRGTVVSWCWAHCQPG